MTAFLELCGWAGIHLLWQGALVGIVAAAGWHGLKDASAPARYALGLACLIALPIGGALSFGLGAAAVSPWATRPRVVGSITASKEALPARRQGLRIRVAADLPPARPHALDFGAWVNRHAARLGVVWITGTALALMLLLISALRLVRLGRRIAESHRGPRPRVKSGWVSSPAVVGVFRPIILLPTRHSAGFDETTRRAALAHEIAHLRRRDPIVNLAQLLVEALVWFHPVAWWISRRVRLEREFCCDARAADRFGAPVIYARALTRMERARSSPGALRLGAGGALRPRVEKLLGIPPTAPPRVHRLRALASLLICAASGFIAVEEEVLLQVDPAPPIPSLHVLQGEALKIPRGIAFPIGEAQDPQWSTSGTVIVPPRGGLLLVDGRRPRIPEEIVVGQELRLVQDDGRTALRLEVRMDPNRGPLLDVTKDGHPATLSGLDAFATLP